MFALICGDFTDDGFHNDSKLGIEDSRDVERYSKRMVIDA